MRLCHPAGTAVAPFRTRRLPGRPTSRGR